jgi:hypothetical protein
MWLARVLIVALMVLAVPAAARPATDALLLRLFLNDGTTLVSYGEYARVDDRVVFSMIVGGGGDMPRLHPVTLPARLVDWTRTDRHAASARYQQYAATRGEQDFQRLNDEVAAALNGILHTKDRGRALEIAERAWTTLAAWPREHYGYRQHDVQEVLAVLDEAISGLRGGPVDGSFNLTLVAMVPEPAFEPLATMPTVRQQIDDVLRVAALTDRTVERLALLQSAVVLLNEAASYLPPSEASTLRRRVDAQIRLENAIDAKYTQLAQRFVTQATRAAAQARIGDVEQVLTRIRREDSRLGGRRPEVVQALVATVQGQLEAARHLRLLRDQWALRRSAYRGYQRAVGTQLLQLVKAQPALESIRRLEGPSPSSLVTLRARLVGGAERLSRMQVPDDFRPVHDLLVGSWSFAENALNGRYDAIQSADVATAWEASSAAAGSLMMLTRLQQEIRALLEPPRLP